MRNFIPKAHIGKQASRHLPELAALPGAVGTLDSLAYGMGPHPLDLDPLIEPTR